MCSTGPKWLGQSHVYPGWYWVNYIEGWNPTQLLDKKHYLRNAPLGKFKNMKNYVMS